MDGGMVLNNGTVSCVDSEGQGIVRWQESQVVLIGTASVSLGQYHLMAFSGVLEHTMSCYPKNATKLLNFLIFLHT